jgi:hypothetical protein
MAIFNSYVKLPEGNLANQSAIAKKWCQKSVINHDEWLQDSRLGVKQTRFVVGFPIHFLNISNIIIYIQISWFCQFWFSSYILFFSYVDNPTICCLCSDLVTGVCKIDLGDGLVDQYYDFVLGRLSHALKWGCGTVYWITKSPITYPPVLKRC